MQKGEFIMAKVSFSSLKLKTKDDIKTIKIGEKEVEVKQYLPAADKNSILECAMQRADESTVMNTFALDALFHLYIVFKYTNLSFTDAQKEDLFKLYDILESNEIIDMIISAIPEVEYNTLRDNLLIMEKAYAKYRNSARAVVEQFTMFAPNSAQQMNEVLKDFDMNKMQQVVDLASATGQM
jgi:hypothetical protein